ncbi:MAG: elongation factor G [Hyphomicrobiaceae bacterium]|nr:elongation factor G [Hyphomicrobiaceae bacterium]
MGQAHSQAGSAPRCIALVGPYQSGKTSVFESILEHTGVINRQGSVDEGNSVGDASPEARAHNMSVELNVAQVEYLGDQFTFIDCPGSIEFAEDANTVLPVVDAAIVVCEPDEKKTPALQLILKQLEERNIPHFLFLNKIDKAEMHVRDIIPMLQPSSTLPLVLRQIPIWKNNIVTGFVDLASERAYLYNEHKASTIIDLPDELAPREEEARFNMMEQLADYDDELMEQLLDDVPPPQDKIFDDLSEDLRKGIICPVLLGSALNGNGIYRLLKALRHEVPDIETTRKRLGVEARTLAHVMKTLHTEHGGKLSLVRVFAGEFKDGEQLTGSKGTNHRLSGLFNVLGQEPSKYSGVARPGDVLAFGRLEEVQAGESLSKDQGKVRELDTIAPRSPVYGLAISARSRRDEVKLTAAIDKLVEEDQSLSLQHDQTLGELVLWGQGEVHLKVAGERLTRKFGIGIESRTPNIPYKETISGHVEVRGRHKKQSGGHGQFGDVLVEIKPMPRGTGFTFFNSISGGVVPKNYIPAVEHGIEDYLGCGPLGFPVVDLAVELKDGSYHAVDSSEQAFRMAGVVAMKEGMPQCKPILLEPVMAVEIAIPSEATARINGIVSSHRGQILGFDARPGWLGWDLVKAQMPQSELQRLIVDIRSATAGVGTFTFSFDHLAVINGRLREQILEKYAA